MIRHFEEELKDLSERILEMGKMVESMIDDSMRALIENKPELKTAVSEHEHEVNLRQIEIDETCIALIALQQPTAVDLRSITSTMKINGDLERMGDQAINIIEHGLAMAACMGGEIITLIKTMSEKVRAMVRDSLESFVKKDITLAKEILERDDEVDALKNEIFQKLAKCMKENPETIEPSLDLIIISRNLERLGDHATNIAEDVIYMVAGKDIRHHIQENR